MKARMLVVALIAIACAQAFATTTPHTWSPGEVVSSANLNSMSKAIMELQQAVGLNPVLTSGSYDNPPWITSLSGTKITPTSLAVGAINAYGTPLSTNFLRGDGTWATPSLSSNVSTSQIAANGAAGRMFLESDDANPPVWSSLSGNDIISGTVSPSYLGTGSSISTKYLRGDGTWQTIGSGTGTVTSVQGDGGSTGLTLGGGPVTTSGTLTLGGILNVVNGGTGSNSASGARTALGLAIGTNVLAPNGSAASLTAIPAAQITGTVPATLNVPTVVNVRAYGAVGDGVANDYTALKNAVAAVANGSTLYFPVGTYLIDQKVGDGTGALGDFLITGKSGFSISGYGATIKVKGGSALTDILYPLNPIRLASDSNFTVQGLTLEGNSTSYSSSTQTGDLPQCSGITTSACTDYVIRDVTAIHWPCDGALLGTSATTADQRVTISNCRFNSNVRCGLSLYQIRTVSVRDSTFVGNGITSGLSGRAPYIGLGVEPGTGGPELSGTVDATTGNITVSNCRFYDNAGTHAYAGGGTIIDGCTFDGCTFEDGSDTTTATTVGCFLLSCKNGVASNCTFTVRSFECNFGAVTGATTRILHNRITIKDPNVPTSRVYAGLSVDQNACNVEIADNDITLYYTTATSAQTGINIYGDSDSLTDFINNRVTVVGETYAPTDVVAFSAVRTCSLNRYKGDSATKYVNYAASSATYPFRDTLDTNVADHASGTAGLWTLAWSLGPVANIPIYANNAAAVAGGLAAGRVYRTNGDPDPLCVVH